VGEGEALALRRLRELQVEKNGALSAQPDWLRFLFEVGAALGTRPERTCGAVVLPVSRIATAAICAGVVVARAAAEFGMSPDLEEHVRLLQLLAVDTPVTYVRHGRLLRGLLRGVRSEKDGLMLVGVKLESDKAGGLTRWIDIRDALAIRPTKDVGRLPDVQLGEWIGQENALLDHLFGPAGDAISRSFSTDAVCIGNKRELAEDLSEVTLGWRGSARSRGKLSDLARVAELGVAARASRARWQAATRVDAGGAATVAIFGSADAFLRARRTWGSSSWIAVLDRADPSFIGALETTKQTYLEGGYRSLPWNEDLPHGVELLLWSAA